MKEYEGFKTLEREDIEAAIGHISMVGNVIEKWLRRLNHEGQGAQDSAEFSNDLNIVLTAASLGAEVAAQQGGMAVTPKDLSEEDLKEVKNCLKAMQGETNK